MSYEIRCSNCQFGNEEGPCYRSGVGVVYSDLPRICSSFLAAQKQSEVSTAGEEHEVFDASKYMLHFDSHDITVILENGGVSLESLSDKDVVRVMLDWVDAKRDANERKGS